MRAKLAMEQRPLEVGRPALIMITLMAVSVFGPYVAGGLRLDQIVVYGLGLLLLPFVGARLRFTVASAAMLSAWLAFAAIAVLVWALAGPLPATPWGPGSVPASADNLALSAVTFLLTIALVRGERELALHRVAQVVAVGMSVNAALGLGQLVRVPGLDATLHGFWGAGGTGDRAVTVGRYTALMGQPSVAGIMYSLALICTIYAFRNRATVRLIVITLLVVGGVLTLSKGFLLGGLPIAAWQLLRMPGRVASRVAFVIFAFVAVIGVAATGLLNNWSGLHRLLFLLPGGGAGLHDYTGNRYGAGASTSTLMQVVLANEPINGFGLAGVATATDTAFVYGLALGGILGVVAILIATLVPLRTFWVSRHLMLPSERLLFGGIALVIGVTSVGAPTLIANRASVIIWMLLGLLLSNTWSRSREPVDEATGMPAPKAAPSQPEKALAGRVAMLSSSAT